MNIAILGATSQIAKDLIREWCKENKEIKLNLFSRKEEVMNKFMTDIAWKNEFNSRKIDEFEFVTDVFDVVINFIGFGNPADIAANANSIIKLTSFYDDMIMNYLLKHHQCKYIFISSGSVYGNVFHDPVDENSTTSICINNISKQDYYSIAKMYAEANHRLNTTNTIIDVRVFNIFSRYHDISAKFFMTDIARSIQEQKLLITSPENIVRDFLHPKDFANIVNAILDIKGRINMPVDCYSKAPVEKFKLLEYLTNNYGLEWEVSHSKEIVNATGNKVNYYSKNKAASLLGYEPTLTSLEGICLELNA